MKNLLLQFVLVLSSISIMAQDLILTIEDEIMEVEIVKVDSEQTLYKDFGKKEVKTIGNPLIKFCQLSKSNSRKIKNDYSKIHNAIMIQKLNSTDQILVKKQNGIYILSKIMTIACGAVLIASLSDDDVGPISLLGMLVFGGIAIGTKGLNKGYDLKSTKSLGFVPLSQETISLLNKQQAQSSYLSASTSGMGLQLNF